MFLKSREIPSEELDKLEPWFSTKYGEADIPKTWAKACQVRGPVVEYAKCKFLLTT